jgi:uncharacterized protein (DUF2062 family)
VATSSAIGMLIGLSPYLGFHTLLAVTISYIFKLPVYPLILGAYITNPFTIVIIYAFLYKIGLMLTGIHVHFNVDWSNLQWTDLYNNLKELFWPLFVGCHVTGGILAVFTYFIVYYIVKKYRENK